jgi:nicotinamidase/pyrazinamidase
MAMNTALLVIDVQRDFCEGGALAATNTASLLPILKQVVSIARNLGVAIIFSQDWHPLTHQSFESNGGRWPLHCVAESAGAELILAPDIAAGDVVIRKGVTPEGDGYSAFDSPELTKALQRLGIGAIAVAGIATEYCVRSTALDAIKATYNVAVLTDVIRAVNPVEAATILQDLASAGVKLMTSAEWLSNPTAVN